jgi:nucleotide-binding universal stress UspA family protein
MSQTSGVMPFLRRILVATDFSDGAERAVDDALELAAELAVPLVLLHVYRTTARFDDDGPWPAREADAPELRARCEEALGRRRERAPRLAPVVDVVIAKGEPADEIVRVAADRGCDLIVLGPHRERAPDAELASTAARVVRRAPCAVLIGVRP